MNGPFRSAISLAPFLAALPLVAVPPAWAQADGILSPSATSSLATPETTAAPGPARDPAARVERLLDRLGAAEGEGEARRIERLIVEAWHRSGSDTVDLLLQRANAAIQDKGWALALEYLDTIVELAPDFAEGWNKRATVYYMINDYERSISDIGRVLTLQPRHFGALSGLGMIFREINQPSRALSAFRQALEVHPYFGDTRSNVDRLAIEVEGRGI